MGGLKILTKRKHWGYIMPKAGFEPDLAVDALGIITPKEVKRKWISVLALALILLTSCSYTCRRVSVEEGRYWQSQGYQTQIMVYQVAKYPKASENTHLEYYPQIFYTHHAQAQVMIDGKWKWASKHTLSDQPDRPILGNGETYAVEEWYAILITSGLYN